jgi:hypothetical protein
MAATHIAAHSASHLRVDNPAGERPRYRRKLW